MLSEELLKVHIEPSVVDSQDTKGLSDTLNALIKKMEHDDDRITLFGYELSTGFFQTLSGLSISIGSFVCAEPLAYHLPPAFRAGIVETWQPVSDGLYFVTMAGITMLGVYSISCFKKSPTQPPN